MSCECRGFNISRCLHLYITSQDLQQCSAFWWENVTTQKGNLDSGVRKFLPMELGIWKCLFGKSGIQLKESGILLTIRIQNPSLTCRKFWYPVIGIWNPLHGIQKSKTVSNSRTWGDKYITVSCWNYHHWLLVSKFQCQWHIPTQSTPSLPSLKVLSKEGWFHIRVVFMCIRERPLVVCIKVAHSDAFAPDINWGPESLSKVFFEHPTSTRSVKAFSPNNYIDATTCPPKNAKSSLLVVMHHSKTSLLKLLNIIIFIVNLIISCLAYRWRSVRYS